MALNESYYPTLASLKDGTYKKPFMARIGFIVSITGRTLLKAVQPDRKRKIKTFPIWEPRVSDSSANLLAQFRAHKKS